MEDFEDFETPPPAADLLPCKICGRTFLQPALKKHTPICQKAATKKRRIFDSSRQRAEGTDISTVKPLKPKPEPPKKQSNWRRKHEDFIATIRAAKGLTQTMKEGGPLPPPPPPSYDPDYIQCPCCQRRFGENAAERHIKFCKEQAARITNKSKFPADAKGKPPAKTQYKPLAVKKTNSPAAPISASSRLPQRSSPAQTTGGIPSNRTPSAGPIKNNALGYSPSRTNSTGLTSPQSGINMKSKPPTSPGSLKNTSGIPGNRRKVYNADSYASRNEGRNTSDVDYSSPLSGGGNKGSDGNFPSQLSKFCHECGTKHPVEWAKFCCASTAKFRIYKNLQLTSAMSSSKKRKKKEVSFMLCKQLN